MKLKLSESEVKRLNQAAVQVLLKEQMESLIRERVNVLLLELEASGEVTPEEIIAKYLEQSTIATPSLLVPK